MKTKQPGYPLPSGTLGNDEIACQLVYLPDRPEYWQAFLATYHYLTTWRAWERDDDKRGKDAAANFREAFELTMGCWRMTCLAEITSLLEQILAAQCECGAEGMFTQKPPGLAPNTESEIEDDVGDPPDVYGDQEITTWGDWAEYKCEAAHYMVEMVALKLEEFEELLELSVPEEISIEMAGWAIAKVSPLLVFISLGWDIFQALSSFLWETLGDFSGAAAEIRLGKAAITCTIANADGPEDCAEQFELACKDAATGTAADILLGLFPWRQWANIIYTGIGEDQDGNEILLTDYLAAPGTNECCLPVPPVGGSSYPATIVNVECAHPWVTDITFDGNSWDITFNDTGGGGYYVEVDITLAASPYWGYPNMVHRGLVYRYVRETDAVVTGSAPWQWMNVLPGGGLHDYLQKIALFNSWHTSHMYSNPYGGYSEEVRVHGGFDAWYQDGGTHGLTQNPDQERTLRIRYNTDNAIEVRHLTGSGIWWSLERTS